MSAIPAGPIDREPLDYPTPGVYPDTARKAEILTDLFRTAGVELGKYDDRIAVWLAQTADWSTFAVIASWVKRAAQGGQPTPAKQEQAEQEQTAEILGNALEAYFAEVDPEEADTDDMAWTLVRALGRAGR